MYGVFRAPPLQQVRIEEPGTQAAIGSSPYSMSHARTTRAAWPGTAQQRTCIPLGLPLATGRGRD